MAFSHKNVSYAIQSSLIIFAFKPKKSGKDNEVEITLWNTNLKTFLSQKAAKIMRFGKDNAGKDNEGGLY